MASNNTDSPPSYMSSLPDLWELGYQRSINEAPPPYARQACSRLDTESLRGRPVGIAGRKFQDVTFILLYLWTILITGFIMYSNFTCGTINNVLEYIFLNKECIAKFIGACTLSSFGLILILRILPKTMIVLVNVAFLVGVFSIGTYLCIIQQYYGALLYFVSCLYLIRLCYLFNCLSFSAASITWTIDTTFKNPVIYIFYIVGSAILITASVLYFLLFQQLEDVNSWQYFFCIFSYFWTVQVILNVLLCIMSGATYNRFFKLGDLTVKYTFVSLTTSFGSICFGSLIIAVIQVLRFIASQSDNEENFIASFFGAILKGLLYFLEDLLDFLNLYAFSHVTMYGKSYVSAAKDSWKMILDQSMEEVVGNDITTSTIDSFMLLIYAILFMLIEVDLKIKLCGIPIFAALSHMLRGGYIATIVCYSESPAFAQFRTPKLHKEIKNMRD